MFYSNGTPTLTRKDTQSQTVLKETDTQTKQTHRQTHKQNRHTHRHTNRHEVSTCDLSMFQGQSTAPRETVIAYAPWSESQQEVIHAQTDRQTDR